MARFLFLAQDRNMTNGDFAFFTSWVSRSRFVDRPWKFYLNDPADEPKRRPAFHALKQVRITSLSPVSL